MTDTKEQPSAAVVPSALSDWVGWNRCDVCGRYIAIADFDSGFAKREMVTPDSEYTAEDYETLCKEHIDA